MDGSIHGFDPLGLVETLNETAPAIPWGIHPIPGLK